MKLMRRRVIRGLSLLAGVALAIWAGGCGVDERPLAPAAVDGPGVGAQAPQATTGLVWGRVTAVPQPAARPLVWGRISDVANQVEQQMRTATKVIGLEGGTLKVGYLGGRSGLDDVKASFTVPAGALSAPLEITMTLVGDDLSDLRVIFGPAGTTFAIPAQLTIRLGRDLVDGQALDAIVALHYDANGDLIGDPIPAHLDSSRRFVEIYFDVPGFSTYSLGGGT